MTSVDVVRKYSLALSDISVENKKEKVYVDDLKNVLEVFNNSEELRKCLYSFNIPMTIKKNIVQDIFLDKIDEVVLNFLILLIKNNRLQLLQRIYNDFEHINYSKINVLKITIISADTLDEKTVTSIKEKFKTMYKANDIVADLAIDKSLIGGIKVIFNDKVIDDSIKHKLHKLKKVIGGL